MRTNDTLDPLVTALSVLRKIYTEAIADDFGNVVISENTYPNFFRDILGEIGKLERVIASSLEVIKMGMPYSKINIGDVFESPLAWTGSDILYVVVDKADGLIEIRSSYQHPRLPETMWKKPSDRIFNKRVLIGFV